MSTPLTLVTRQGRQLLDRDVKGTPGVPVSPPRPLVRCPPSPVLSVDLDPTSVDQVVHRSRVWVTRFLG